MPRWVEKWDIPSSSNPNKTYVVAKADDGTFGCSCPAWTRMRRECKHIKAVKVRALDGRKLELYESPFESPATAAPKTAAPRQKTYLERRAEEAPWRF